MLCNGSSARAYSRADQAVLLQDPVQPWLYPKSRTKVCPCRNEHKTQSGELARGKGTAHLHQTTFHYSFVVIDAKFPWSRGRNSCIPT